jgi:hypothetical protein
MITLTPEAAPVKARRTTRALYQPLDIHRDQTLVWPAMIPRLTEAEAVKAAKLLWRWCVKQAPPNRVYRFPASLPVKVTSGRRYNRILHGHLVVNPGRGWRNLVHELSHAFHYRLRPTDRPHSDSHRHLERDLIHLVVGAGWLEGRLQPKARAPREPAVHPDQVAYDRNQAAIKRWATKLKRAQNALAKLQKEERKLRRKRDRIPFKL